MNFAKQQPEMAQPPKQHSCRPNWTGSSKAMEADVAVELGLSTSQQGAHVAVLVGDGDSCTIKRVRESVSHEVEKWSDTVHAKRSFRTSLYALQSDYKGILSAKVIDYFLKCFGYALAQNKGSVQSLQKKPWSNCSSCFW